MYSKKNVNFILISLFFGVCYWMLEAVRDVIVFRKGDIFHRIFTPDPFSFWMRLLVIMLLLLFGAYTQSLREKVERGEKNKTWKVRHFGIIYSGIVFGALYWFLASLRDAIVLGKANLIHQLIQPDPLSVWMRLLAVCIVMLFSIYAQNLFEGREQAKQALQKVNDELEEIVRQRTAELSLSNELLKKENVGREQVEDELLKVNRALKTLSQCNEVMVRSIEESVLFNNICKTIVHTGGYQMAWVGLAELNGGLHVRSVSCANQPDSQMDLVALTDSHNEEQADPIREVVQTGQMKIIKYDPQKSNRTPWEDAALERGFTASVILPLGSGDRFFGVLSIYTLEPETFDKGEVDLLQELADDITFGVSTLRMRIERNKAEAEKERIQAQLHQSQKMEAVGILAGGIAHDFNNLLTAIQVSADLAMLELPESDSVYTTLQEIHRVASNAGDLAKQMLLFSRKHPMEYAPMRLNQVVTDLQKMLRRLIGEDIEIETRLDTALWNVMADKGTMEQVVMNLAINARDAMPKGGRLIIQTENENIKGKSVHSDSDARCGKFVKLTIQDNGMGMDKEILSHIFEPFFSTKSPGKGTGLGLSVVYGIIKQHEGWITTSSAPGEGSTFEIYLPASIESAVSSSKKKKVSANPCGKGERILIVEDERIVQESTDKALVKSGYSVLSASNGAEALKIFENEGGAFDLVFSDVVLPDRNGIELVETLKSKNPKIKVLLSSGYTDYKAQWPVIIERGFQYLQKPYMMNNLLQTLRKVLDA